MSGYQSFAVWGAGDIGKPIINELLLRGMSTTVLTRPASVNKDVNVTLAKKGAIIRAFDVNNAAEAIEALRGIDVLISTIGYDINSPSNPLKIALDAGVKLYVPNEWGITTDGLVGPMFEAKASVRAEALKLGIPTAAFFTGLWSEWIHNFGWDLKAGNISIGGTGDALFSTTSVAETARFVAYVLTSLPRDQIENAKFTLETERITFNSLASALQHASGKSIEITHIPTAVLEEGVKKGDIVSFLSLFVDSGKGVHPNPPSNHLYPDWNPKGAVDIILQQNS